MGYRVNTEKKFHNHQTSGFALPLAMGLGLAMIALATTATIVAQSDRQTSLSRRESSASTVITEGGIARLLAQLRSPNNSILLTRNYDLINPDTGKLYLGVDATPNSGDENAPVVDQWTNYPASIHPCAATVGVGTAAPNLIKSGSIDTGNPSETNNYALKAYRYDATTNTGTLLVEGEHSRAGGVTSSTYIMVKFSVLSSSSNFPGLLVSEAAYLQGRSISGNTGNVFFANDDNDRWESRDMPYLEGVSAPGDTNRPTYLNAIFSGNTDGYNTDRVAGKLAACNFTHTLPIPTISSFVDNFNITGSQTITAPTSGINYYQVANIDLKNNDVLTVDTTLGPVYIYNEDKVTMHNASRIINVRSDGKPPRVGDLRIYMTGGDNRQVDLFDSACIQNAFIYNPMSDVRLQTKGSACSSQSSIEGVVWMEDLLSSRTSTTTRLDPQPDQTIILTPGITYGIKVPDDVSSLNDVLDTVNWPIQSRFGEIKSWQKVRL